MAVKDWSLTSKNKGEYHYRKGYAVISINLVEEGSFAWEQHKAKYSFSTNKGDKPIYFKKKSTARKYAMKYMRKH